jgi:hypothetical protein
VRDDADDGDDDEQEDEQEARSNSDKSRDEAPDSRQDRQSDGRRDEERQRTPHDDDAELDWNAELEWSPPPRPKPAPVAFTGAPPYLPGARVRVDLAGLPLLGVFLGKGASAAGTIVGVNAQERVVCVHLDACFDGEKQIVLPPERVVLDR